MRDVERAFYTIPVPLQSVQAMPDENAIPSNVDESSVADQFTRAVRDLWTMMDEVDDRHVIFTDRRHLRARVDRLASGSYGVSWQTEDGIWMDFDREFDTLREAAFRGYQGPH